MKRFMLNLNCLFTMLFLILIVPVYSQTGDMLAEITEPVTTDFGIYYPNPVTITASAWQYEVDPGFSNVINFNDFNFNDAEKKLLRDNYFLVTPKRKKDITGYKEIYDIYNECREQGIPIFVTTDAMLHTFHLCFDTILKELEEKQFYLDLHNLLSAILDEALYQQYPAITDATAKSAMMRTIDYLIIAKLLLDSTYVPPINEGNYPEEIKLIEEHDQWVISPIMGYQEDYSQYLVRGHYTRSDTLKQYFRSMMWLGRMAFAADPQLKSLSRQATLSALLLIQALDRISVNGEDPMTVWDRIYSPTVFLVGKSDDITPQQYLDLAHQVYGSNFAQLDVNSLGSSPEFDEFLDLAKKFPGPKITYPDQPKGLRFMGQRFVPDSYILDELVFNKIPGRTMPKGLDVMVVLGSERARKHLEDMGEMTNQAYADKLDSLCVEFKSYSPDVWAQNLYWNWLYSLMPLLFPKLDGYPSFMCKPAWWDKELFAVLGSWAELRHDTILYVKQSGTETCIPPVSALEQGYVEPNPYLYGRLASLARFLITGLNDRNLLFPKFKRHLEHFESLALSLKSISEKELLRQSLSPEDYQLIAHFGLEIEAIAEFSEWGGTEGPNPMTEDEMPVIADVHTDKNSLTCLEEGVGYPFVIYVIAPIEGQLKLTRGGGFSYYEFTHTIDPRLTDEAWREMLKNDSAPDLPNWAGSFIDADWQNLNPEYYFWHAFGLKGFFIEVQNEAPVVGELISLRLTTNHQFSDKNPTVIVEKPDGTSFQISNISQDKSDFACTFNTAGWQVGQYWIAASAEIRQWEMESPAKLNYRTGFFLGNTTDVEENHSVRPGEFNLAQNYPNPFNPETRLSYQLSQKRFISLKIYDALGRQVRILVNEEQSVGRYEIVWDGKDQFGLDVPSGLYFAHLVSGEFVQSRKLILMR